MVAVTPKAEGHEGLAPLASRYVQIDQIPWQSTRFPGIEIKVLLEDKETGLLTTLLRMAPGACLPDHEHVRIEQTYVLEGRLVDDEGECHAGDFVWRPAGSRHLAHTPDGGLMLAFFLQPNRFFDQDPAGAAFDPEQGPGD
jgi:anti-sigma factor ChrR (cupin superfamily)